MNKKVAMMQPSFLPWQGYFELILKSDTFIVLDDFQFSVQSYHQRNKLFVNKNQTDWYTIPVQKQTSFMAPLNETKIDYSKDWGKKLWKRLKSNYGKAYYFKELAPWIESWILKEHNNLALLNQAFILETCQLFEYNGEIKYSSDNKSDKLRSERVLELLEWCNADTYLAAKGSFEYMLEDGLFPDPEITVLFQDYTPKPYKQISSDGVFVPYLSVLDAILNIGISNTKNLILQGTEAWHKWEDRLADTTHSEEIKNES